MKIPKVLHLENHAQQLMNQIAGMVWLVCSLMLVFVLASLANAQNYEALPIHPDFVLPKKNDFDNPSEYRAADREVKNRLKAARSAVTNAVKSGNTNFGPDGDKYMLEYRLARMTQTSDAFLSSLGILRTDFMKQYMDRKPAAIRRAVITKVLPELEKIALGDQFHPAVRVNAVTMIGLLDERGGDSGTPPVPSAAAYQSLKRIWAANGTLEAVKAGALSGVRRFAEISRRGPGDQSSVGDIKNEMLAILGGTAAGQDKWKPDFDYWMKRRATQILGFIGEGNDVVDAVTKTMKTASEDGKRNNFWLRYDGLQALANLRFAQLDSGKVEPLVDDVLGFVADALELEATMLQSQVDDLVYTNILWGDYDLADKNGRRPRGGSGGGLGGGGGRCLLYTSDAADE